MSMTYVSSNHSIGKLSAAAAKLEQGLVERLLQQNEHSIFDLTSHKELSAPITSHETEKGRKPTILKIPNSGTSVTDHEQSPSPAPICRQFWKAGNYNGSLNSKPTCQGGIGHLRIHPKFLHSNATSHKWVFGAVAELLDNSVDEIRNGATFVVVDKMSNPRDGNTALLVQDDGGGMDPEAMRRCLSFGFSDKKSQETIGKYGNGFKTSSMRLGADVVVFSRCKRNRRLTQSVGLLSYTYLMRTRQDKIVVPMVDYEFDTHCDAWKALHNERYLKNNLSVLLQWSPVATEAELLKQCDDIGPHGTKIIVYNLWHGDEGEMELDFDSDPEDIRISSTEKVASQMKARDHQHLANHLQYSLRAYFSILYLQVPVNFCIILRGRVVEYHNIANDLRFPEFILYRPHNVEGGVLTTIGFLKEAPAVNIHGFNVYHKNRLILPFWHVISYTKSIGRGVVGVLEADFIEPTHNKQDFEKTPVFQKLEARLRDMTKEYWYCHCELIGYQDPKNPPAKRITHAASNSILRHGVYKSVTLGEDSGAFSAKASFAAVSSQHEVSGSLNHVAAKSERSLTSIQGATFKRKERDNIVELESVKKRDVAGPGTFGSDGDVQLTVDTAKQLGDQEAAIIIKKNQEIRAECLEFEKTDEELNLKIIRLTNEVREAQREYTRMLLESRLLEKVKKENSQVRHV